jgi:hypothetical protein
MDRGIEQMEELLRTVEQLVKGLDNSHQLNLAFTSAQEEHSRRVFEGGETLWPDVNWRFCQFLE